MISLIIPVYKRFEHLPSLLEAWRPQVDEIIVWDESPKRSGRMIQESCDQYIWSSFNHGSHIKFKIGLLASGETLVVADDDVMPAADTVARLVEWDSRLHAPGDPYVLGGYGRRLGPGYQSHVLRKSTEVTVPFSVDFLGRIYYGRRELFVNMRACEVGDGRMDDLWWSMCLRDRGVSLYVVPFPWSDCACCNDEHSVSRGKGFFADRDAFVRRRWAKEVGHV